MEKKEKTEKTEVKPLQAEKEERKQEILAEAEGPKRIKRGRPAKAAVVVPPPDLNAIEQEAKFFLALIGSGREMIGVVKAIPDMTQAMFIQSYKGLVLKYGDIATKWMPEILFVCSAGLIIYDTRECLIAQKKEKEKEKK